ncbi:MULTISPECIES: hypothetical protein [unclassified Mucilaginibacter]|uniref:hypothetical protein n=1 Tax=unclassified Mucilaginibacter TaxID=2617802 RepID=UPI002AC8C622|nr:MULTISPECIES: hypothetical protein [unclassified Mucilaginibacter]MEB0263241.1 hypothetical protein [Mucilaginibacter sp. 10I4]MEB0280312.1 hypothetical protein [Mucilaginibacter sp. 10B2]MEB0300257.1 hypothetical protein [Mucilaginibacter sp. 5C4]WPX25614.1 hypothetical protein RHM67_10080 [Mucilaginibacter sp. 5C4]
MKGFFIALFLLLIFSASYAQHSDEVKNLKELKIYQDSLKSLGKKFINDPDDLERKNANYRFIRMLVAALKVPHSFNYPFDSVKAVSIINSPDNRFRILSWHVMNQDGSYRFYGTVQMNTGDNLLMYPLEDYSPFLKNPEDSITDNHKWYGAQYYKIIRVAAAKPYYVLLGWKGNTVKSTKKVIEVLSFDKDDKPNLGAAVFDGNSKNRKRVVFEYTRQASMLLRYVPDQNLIVFDHLSPPDQKMKDHPEAFGPDLSYDGYKLKNGRWVYVNNLDMRNIPEDKDATFVDPKAQAIIDRSSLPARKKN